MLIDGDLVDLKGFWLDVGRHQIVYCIVQVLRQRKRPFDYTSLAANPKAVRLF